MAKHKWENPQTCRCGGQTMKCAVCDFGLAFCVVCKGAECQITTECCGRPLTEEEGELVCRGDLDYDMGVWFKDGKPVFTNGRVHR